MKTGQVYLTSKNREMEVLFVNGRGDRARCKFSDGSESDVIVEKCKDYKLLKDVEEKISVTEKEMQVYREVIELCYHDAGAEVKIIAKNTGMPTSSVKGLVGSLAKKGLLDTIEDERLNDRDRYIYVDIIYPSFSENKWYMCDEFEWSEIEEFLNKVEIA